MESDEAAAAGAASPSGGNVTPAPKKRGRKPKSKDETQTQQEQEERGGKMKESGKKTKQGEQSVDEKYTQWKGLVPILYDLLANHNLVWPSLSCRSFPLSLSLSTSSRVSWIDLHWRLNC